MLYSVIPIYYTKFTKHVTTYRLNRDNTDYWYKSTSRMKIIKNVSLFSNTVEKLYLWGYCAVFVLKNEVSRWRDEERLRKPRIIFFCSSCWLRKEAKHYFGKGNCTLESLVFERQFRQKGNCERMEQTNEGRDAYLKLMWVCLLAVRLLERKSLCT